MEVRTHMQQSVALLSMQPTFLHFVAQHVDLRLAGARALVQVQTGDLQLRGGRSLCK